MGIIYKIQNNVNNKIYIGRTKSTLNERSNKHKHLLNNNKHHATELQRDWNIYKAENFSFIIIEETFNELQREQFYIDKYNTYTNGYNVARATYQSYGEKHQKAKYTNKTYQDILGLLANTEDHKTYQEIANITNTTHEVVKSIFLGRSHAWLKEIYPEEYEEVEYLRSLGNRSKLLIKHIQALKLIETKSIEEIISITQLTKEQLKQILNKIKLIRNYPKQIQMLEDKLREKKVYPPLISPEGKVYDNITNMASFCKEHNLSRSAIHSVIKKTNKQHKNWKIFNN